MESPNEVDVTKLAHNLPAKPEPQPSATDEALTYSLTNTFSTIQSLGGDLQAYAKTIKQQHSDYGDAKKSRSQSHNVRKSASRSDQSSSDIDPKAFTADLQLYYRKIHSDIAQLKTILNQKFRTPNDLFKQSSQLKSQPV